MENNEIIKALECCMKNDCDNCFNSQVKPQFQKCNEIICKEALDLINRLQAQNKDLAETIHNLTLEKDALFDKAEELKAEVERLNGK